MPADPFTLGDAAAAGSVAGIVFNVLAWLRRRYNSILGKRRDQYRKVARLVPGMSLDFVKELFGEPTFREVRKDADVVVVWVEPEFYLQARARHEKVIVWSLTTRSRRFHPKLFRRHLISSDGASLELTLGRTRFVDLPSAPRAVSGYVGAHSFEYAEAHYYGNPGNYLHYVYSINQSANAYEDTALIEYFVGDRSIAFGSQEAELEQYLRDAVFYRTRMARFNTVGVIDWSADETSHLTDATGPDWNRVRLLAKPRSPLLERIRSWGHRN